MIEWILIILIVGLAAYVAFMQGKLNVQTDRVTGLKRDNEMFASTIKELQTKVTAIEEHHSSETTFIDLSNVDSVIDAYEQTCDKVKGQAQRIQQIKQKQ
jgi:CRISPR/Cas system CMR-associated protein Cmr5 small subunit